MNIRGIVLLSVVMFIAGMSFAHAGTEREVAVEAKAETKWVKPGTNNKLHTKKRRVYVGASTIENKDAKILNPKRRNWNYVSSQSNGAGDTHAIGGAKRARTVKLIEKHRTGIASPKGNFARR